jgi:hypothetical protein
MASKKKKPKDRNPVAKNMNKFNKPATMRDRKNDYKRSSKKAELRKSLNSAISFSSAKKHSDAPPNFGLGFGEGK